MQTRTITAAVPAGAGTYAPEVLYCNSDNDKRTLPDRVGTLAINVASLPAGATLEVDLLKPGADPAIAASWRTAVATIAAAGLAALLQLGNWHGVRVRAKSGGTAGALEFDATWSRTAE